MPIDIEEYECLAQREDDVVNFLPSVTNLDVFGCEVDLVRIDTQQPLRDPIRDTLKHHSRFQVIVRPCVEVGHNIWHFQNDNRPGYPKAVLVPANDLGAIPDSAFYAAPTIRHVEVAQGLHTIGAVAWQSCQQLQIVKLPPSVVCLKDGALQGCYALTQVIAPGCVQFGRRVFAECCSLGSIGVSEEAENELVPGAQISPYAFESCLALSAVTFAVSKDVFTQALPEGNLCGSGIERLQLPPDFKHLVQVNLICTDISSIWGSTFSYCAHLVDIWLPPKLRRIGKETFLSCASLKEVYIPPALHYFAHRAFFGCEQLTRFIKSDEPSTWRGPYAESSVISLNAHRGSNGFHQKKLTRMPLMKNCIKGCTRGSSAEGPKRPKVSNTAPQ